MKTFLTSLLLSLFAMASAQECEVYIPTIKGTTLSYDNFDGKDKLTSQSTQTLVSVESTAEGTVYKMNSVVKPVKGEETSTDLIYKCIGNRFIFDMSSFVDPKMKESLGTSEIKMTMDEMNIPFGAVPGTQLPDGKVEMQIVSESPINMTLKTTITERKILAYESVTTPAGTFNCLKISQTVVTDMMMAKVTVKSTDWFAKNVGLVKSETVSKTDKPISKMVLTVVKQ